MYRHQQIIIICNELPKIFDVDEAVRSRVTIIEVQNDLRDYTFVNTSINRRLTTRGNHLRNPPPDAYVKLLFLLL